MKNIIHTKTVTEAHKLLGLGKPKHPLITIFYHADMKVEMAYEDTWFSSDLYFIALKDGITGSFEYGRNAYDFNEGAMIFMGPGQLYVPSEVEIEEDSKGWTLLFHPDLIRRSPLGENIEKYSFFSYDLQEALHLSDDEKEAMTELVKKIEKEFLQNIDRHSQTLIISYLELLLNYGTRFYDRQFYTRTNLHKDYVSKFEHLLKNYYQSDKPLHQGIPSVKYFGGEMNMSHKYMSDLLKKETGKNAQEHIHEFVINKAKNKLLGTTLSISEIAYDLGFEYSQHFAKLFKSKAGMTPTAYRRMN